MCMYIRTSAEADESHQEETTTALRNLVYINPDVRTVQYPNNACTFVP